MKPKLLVVDEMTPSVQEMLSEHLDLVYPTKDCDITTDFSMIYTGLTPVVTNATVFCPCTSVEHVDAPRIIHLDDEFKQGVGKTVTSTAEHTMWLIQGLSKMNEMQLSGKTLGIIGFGRIGAKVVKYAEAFNLSVGVNEKLLPTTESDWTLELEELLNDSDIVTLHVPLNEETNGMIGRAEIAMMKDGALLVNTSRHQIVDEEAVIEALKSGKLAGYAHDFKPQIHTDTKERWNMWMNSGVNDKVMATPHIAGKTKEAREITDKYIANKILEHIGAV